jgi:hypothetical protein
VIFANRGRLALLLAAFLLPGLVAARATAGSRVASEESLVPRVILDPFGDTFGTHAPQLDLVEFSIENDATNLVVLEVFNGTISPADSPSPNAMIGYIDFDTDRNETTGSTCETDLFAPLPSGIKCEYMVDLGTYTTASGTVDVVRRSSGAVVGRAPVRFYANGFLVKVPLPWLGLVPGQIIAAATVVGTHTEFTDQAPNGGSLESGTNVIRLNNDRFRVDVSSLTSTSFSIAHLVPFRSDESGLYWFFGPDNWELMIKVLNGCSVNDRYWVFFAATTDQGYVVNVYDELTGAPVQYTNPIGRQSPAVTDTSTFRSCPEAPQP